MKSDSIEAQRAQFPGLKNRIYVDTAAAGLLPQSVVDWRRQYDEDLLKQGSLLWPEHIRILNETRDSIRTIFNVGSAAVALVQNFSLGLNLLLEGMDRGMSVLLVEEDYPSVNWPFETRGFNITYVKANQELETQIRDILSKRKIDVFAFSIVQWLNGLKIQPDFLKELKEEYPSLVIIADGTQCCGAFDFDFAQSGIDVLGSSGYKWLLGGYGNGFMIIGADFSARFEVPSIGFNSAEGELGARDQVPIQKRLEPGHLDSLNFGSLNMSLKYLNQIGMSTIENYNRSLISIVKQELGELGLLEKELLHRQQHGTIFRLVAGRNLYEHLRANNVCCSWRAGGIRLSFHFYNTEDEIDQLVQIIKKAG